MLVDVVVLGQRRARVTEAGNDVDQRSRASCDGASTLVHF
jgi:hypothetical protein